MPNGPSTTPMGKYLIGLEGIHQQLGASRWRVHGSLVCFHCPSFFSSFLFSFFTYSHPACLLTRQREGGVEAVEGKHPICIHASCSMRNAVERVSGGDFVVNLGKRYNGRLGGRGWWTVRWVHMRENKPGWSFCSRNHAGIPLVFLMFDDIATWV